MNQPAFIITIDTEGDNLWHNHEQILTLNARFLPRFQLLCEKFGFKPVYLTNYEMAVDNVYVEFAKDVITRAQGEVGMHLHAWNSPPLFDLTGDDGRHKPYLIDYPDELIIAKVKAQTQLLEDTFQTKMLSHRAGRWALNEFYVNVLIENGYRVDCSVTPRVDWRRSPGAPKGQGGTNYIDFPDQAYFINPENIAFAGDSPLLEVPMSTRYKHPGWVNTAKSLYDSLRGKSRTPSVHWLRPHGGNVANMQRVVDTMLARGSDYVEFMLHSSELMPGGSPTFTDEDAIEQLYADLEQLFEGLKGRVVGMTLADFYQKKT
ncbi:deacetylase [Acerihabitans sp. TG2]|uniref:deacetylase n=1 Tax=Acerihabitans sp. TG2 TaxID=3096008 RepID=UPI002B23EB88|nr:deacetylase [Acerihabitans sp. TG2]MEA9392335.1 deacetylase [Acerihabitans sp. TG2]